MNVERSSRAASWSWRAAGCAVLALLLQSGCSREFFREWANQDASTAVFEKSRDPRWRLDLFSVDPPGMSRFADPSDPDVPAAPPDDYAAAMLSPVPQQPNERLIVPLEGTGYIDMMEEWQRQQPAPKKPKQDRGAGPLGSLLQPPPVTPPPNPHDQPHRPPNPHDQPHRPPPRLRPRLGPDRD